MKRRSERIGDRIVQPARALYPLATYLAALISRPVK